MSEFAEAGAEKPIKLGTETTEEENQSSEERIEWLRGKGVHIEIPGEKRVKKTSSMDTRKIKLVRIPCDDKIAMSEIEVTIDNTRFGDQLLEELRPFLASTGTGEFDMNAMKETAAKQFGSADVNITEDVLRSMQEQGGVEAFTLDQPCNDNHHLGVALYLDEASQLKSLPSNRRATQIAHECGFVDVPLAGDIFIGRTAITGGKMTNSSFLLTDVDSSGWMRGAESRNYQSKAAQVLIDMTGDSLQKTSNDSGDEFNDIGVKWTETNTTMDIVFSLQAWAALASTDGMIRTAMNPVEFKSQCKVIFTHKNVLIKKMTGEGGPLLDIVLKKGVDVDDCTYTFSKASDGSCEVEISLEKASSGLWGGLTN